MPITEPDSQVRPVTSEHDDIPKMEPWLGVALSSFVPVLLLLFLPPSVHIPFYVAGGLLLGAGIVMFIRSEMKKRR